MQEDGQQPDQGGPGRKGCWVQGVCGVDVHRGNGAGSWRGFPTGMLDFTALSAISQCPSVLSPPGSAAQHLWYSPFTAVCLRPAHHCCAPVPAPAALPLSNSSLGGDVCPSPQLRGFAYS